MGKGGRVRSSRVLLVALLVSGVVALPAPARASFHLMNIVEIFVGPAENPDAQYVELQMYSGGQTQVQDAQVRFFGPDGSATGTATFASNVPVGTNRSSILVATTAAEATFGVDADLVMDPLMVGEGGRVCFAGTIDCVSWAISPSGTQFTAGDTGIPGGAAIVRDVSGGSDPAALDSGDDTNDDVVDFDLGAPSPRNNTGVVGAPPGGVLAFESLEVVGPEGGAASVTVTRSGGTGTVCATASTADGSATAPDDYTPVAQQICFEEGAASQTFEVSIAGDGVEETAETVLLRLREPTGGAALGAADSQIDISGELQGSLTSAITSPADGATYRASELGSIEGTAGSVDAVQIALQAKMTNGTCRWFDFNSKEFSKRRCTRKRFVTLLSDGPMTAWSIPRDYPLKRSKGTRFKHYTLYSRAVIGEQKETTFERGRNASRFEMR
jgi:hypothetical protein